MKTAWRPPWLWRFLLTVARGLVFLFARLRVTGDVPAELRDGPLILAANHVSPIDPVVMAAACRVRRMAPRFMATGGVFRGPVALALPAAAAALAEGSMVLVYPEGRIGLDPRMWPERGKTGTARLALTTGTAVVPVAQWGAHEVAPYTTPKGLLRGLARAVVRRPAVRVHFGAPVDLSGLAGGSPDEAVRATDRIVEAITMALVPLRADEPDLPRYVDATRPADVTRARPVRVPAPPDGPVPG